MKPLLIALDFSSLDHLTLLNGQYRYCVNLVRGLARMKPAANFVLLGSRPEPVAELRGVIRDEGSRWSYLQLLHHHGRGRYWRDQFAYARALCQLRPTLYHSLDGLVPLVSPCPIVMTQHDLMVELFPEYAKVRNLPFYRVNRWAVIHLAKRAICISKTTASDLRRFWGVEDGRVDVVMHGTEYLSAEAEAARENPSREGAVACQSCPLLLSPYNLEPRKNLAALLHAVARLRHRYPHLMLVLFGRAAVTPEREQAFERIVAKLGLEGAVQRTGPVDDTVLRYLYRQCTMFVFPSLYEGFGLPVLEAMACGACVIARDASAMAEVVGDAGVLVETRDPDLLAKAIALLLDNPRAREQFRLAASQRAASFTIERMARLTYRSYCAALGIEADDCRPHSQTAAGDAPRSP